MAGIDFMTIGIFIYRFTYEVLGLGMAMRTLLIVSGNVQGVGYRTLVKQIANRMRVTGIVRNLPDGNVEIYCQCSDKETLDKFVKQIEIKATTDDVFAVNVDEIKTYEDDHPKYKEPQTDFETLIIDYGRELDQFQRESLERSEIGILLLGGTREDIQNMGNKQDTMNEKLDNITEATIKTHDNLSNIDDRLGNVIERYDAFGEKMTKLEHDIGDLTYQIKRLVDHVVGEEIKGS